MDTNNPMIQSRQGITISAPEEIAYINGFIDKNKLMESAKAYGKSPYGEHLKAVAEGKLRYWFNLARTPYTILQIYVNPLLFRLLV